jgi:hypothetical protein
MKWYYYLHINGDLIGKPPIVADDPDYFSSPFVRKVWFVDTEDRADGYKLVLEALTLGVRIERVAELAEKWKLTKEDSWEFVARTKPSAATGPGLKIFIEQILKMTEDSYWEEFMAWGRAREEAEKKEVKT